MEHAVIKTRLIFHPSSSLPLFPSLTLQAPSRYRSSRFDQNKIKGSVAEFLCTDPTHFLWSKHGIVFIVSVAEGYSWKDDAAAIRSLCITCQLESRFN